MPFLSASSAAVKKIVDALGLPPHTVSFALKARAGEPVTVEVVMLAKEEPDGVLSEVLKQYRLVEMPPDTESPADPSAGAPPACLSQGAP